LAPGKDLLHGGTVLLREAKEHFPLAKSLLTAGRAEKLRRKALWARLKPLFWPASPFTEELEVFRDAERGNAAGEMVLRLRECVVAEISLS
jgi:hypothetical protein